MPDMSAVNGFLSVVLAGASGYGLYKIPPAEKPYGFVACIIGLAHGLVEIYSLVMGEDAGQAKDTSTAVMELVPLPLVNIELYLAADSNNIALGHGLFIVPLVFDMILSFFKDSDGEGETKETLKTLTILGNVTSLMYIAINEGSYWYGGMAALAFTAKYGAMLIESNSEGTGETVNLLSNCGFFYMSAEAIGGEAK